MYTRQMVYKQGGVDAAIGMPKVLTLTDTIITTIPLLLHPRLLPFASLPASFHCPLSKSAPRTVGDKNTLCFRPVDSVS